MLSPAVLCNASVDQIRTGPGSNPGFMNSILITDPFPPVHLKFRRLNLHSRCNAANPVGARRRPHSLSVLSSSSSRLVPNQFFIPMLINLTPPTVTQASVIYVLDRRAGGTGVCCLLRSLRCHVRFLSSVRSTGSPLSRVEELGRIGPGFRWTL